MSHGSREKGRAMGIWLKFAQGSNSHGHRIEEHGGTHHQVLLLSFHPPTYTNSYSFNQLGDRKTSFPFPFPFPLPFLCFPFLPFAFFFPPLMDGTEAGRVYDYKS